MAITIETDYLFCPRYPRRKKQDHAPAGNLVLLMIDEGKIRQLANQHIAQVVFRSPFADQPRPRQEFRAQNGLIHSKIVNNQAVFPAERSIFP